MGENHNEKKQNKTLLNHLLQCLQKNRKGVKTKRVSPHYRVITPKRARHCRLLKNLNILLTFLALGNAGAYMKGGLRRRGGHISVYFSLFVLLCNTNFKKIKNHK